VGEYLISSDKKPPLGGFLFEYVEGAISFANWNYVVSWWVGSLDKLVFFECLQDAVKG